MANIIRFDGRDCDRGNVITITVNDPLSAISSGDTLYVTNIGDPNKSYCVEVGEIGIGTTPSFTFVEYDDCPQCLTNNSLYVLLTICSLRPTEFYPISVSAFTETLSIDQSYYLSFTYDGKPFLGCFYIYGYGSEPDQTLSEVTTTPVLQVDCETCFAENPFVYGVVNCVDGSTKYIQLPNDNYVGHLITYEEIFLGQQFCGVVDAIVDGGIPDITLIADLGEIVSKEQCDECLVQVADKRIITNCLTGNESVVWASTLLGVEDFSNLSSSDGCFDVGELTESAVTISSSFLNFDPQPSCIDCIECNGINYEYVSCNDMGPISAFTASYTGSTILPQGNYGPFTGVTNSDRGINASFYIIFDGAGVYNSTVVSTYGNGYVTGDTITIDGSLFGGISGSDDVIITVDNITTTGTFTSYQYVENPIGTTLYIPWIDDCVEITSFYEGSGFQTIYSFNSLSNCEICNSTFNYVWQATDCITQNTVIVTTPVGLGPGDIVRVKYGQHNIGCATLTTPYDPSMGQYSIFNSIETEPYQTCDDCVNNTWINVSIAECDGSNQQYVSLSLTDYSEYYNNSTPIFNQYKYGKCYVIISSCPVSGDYSQIPVQSFYYNCIDCEIDNTRFPRSANTEYNICVLDCEGNLISVNPPHAIYSDAFGTDVTQLNTITLGGFNGLNN